MVEPQPSKLKTRVRYPSPALVEPKEVKTKGALKKRYDWGCAASKKLAAVAQLVERVLGKDEVMGSSPISSFDCLHTLGCDCSQCKLTNVMK